MGETYYYHDPKNRREPPLDPLTHWLQYLDSLSWEKGSFDDSGNRAFLRAGSLGIHGQTAFNEVARRIQAGGAHASNAKLLHQLYSAYRYSGSKLPNKAKLHHPIPPKWPLRDWVAVADIVDNGGGLFDLWEASPVQFNDYENHAEEIIDALFPNAPPIDPLLCTGRTESDFATRPREEWRGELASRAYIVPNPMLSVWGKTAEGKLSQHTLEATAARVYQVVEFDFTLAIPEIAEWIDRGLSIADICAALLMHLAKSMPLACVTSSGGKSLHGWFNVFGLSEYRQRAFMELAVRLGADHKLWCRSQFTRIPDGRRETGHRQTCFLLNPKNCVPL